MNLYAYVNNSPLNFKDPSGLAQENVASDDNALVADVDFVEGVNQTTTTAQKEFDGFIERDENGLVSGLDAPDVNSLEGGAGASGSGFIGIAGISLSGGVISDGSKVCAIATACVQFGLGAYGGGGAEGSLSLSQSEGLESGTYETWGFFGQGAIGGAAGGSMNFGDGAVGGARGFIGGGVGGAAGVQFCTSEVYCGD